MVIVDNNILIYAFRYSLGSGNEVEEVQDALLENLYKLKEREIMMIIGEIEFAVGLDKYLDERENWIKFKDKLMAHILGEDDYYY